MPFRNALAKMLPSTTYTRNPTKSGKANDESKKHVHPALPARLTSYAPIYGHYDSRHVVEGCGVAIFHVASKRVVICYHTGEGYWFLPKGRRDAGEESGRAAEREGYEESGFRNRLLPLAIRHRQPSPERPNPNASPSIWVTEPVWTQLAPVGRSCQYLLRWYIAETLPPEVEASISARRPPRASSPASSDAPAPAAAPPEPPPAATSRLPSTHQEPYRPPPPYPLDLSLPARVALEPAGYVPPRHADTGVNEEEMMYTSELVPIGEALRLLGRRSVRAEVVREGWVRIGERMKAEGGVGWGKEDIWPGGGMGREEGGEEWVDDEEEVDETEWAAEALR